MPLFMVSLGHEGPEENSNLVEVIGNPAIFILMSDLPHEVIEVLS